MMTARDRALEILRQITGGWSNAALEAMLADKTKQGESTREVFNAIVAGIERDRRACESARAPS